MSALVSDKVIATPPAADEHRLGLVGRVVGAVLVVGVIIAAPSVFWLFWVVPYAGVGALLAVRRPVTSIGARQGTLS